MEKQKIIRTLSNIFKGADVWDWALVQSVLAENVLLDYSSLSGNPAASTPSRDIIAAWRNFLPGFDKTNHQLSEFDIAVTDNVAVVHCKGKADHFIGRQTWTVEGTYDAEVVKTGSQLSVTKLKFNLEKQTGNTQLPARAVDVMNARKNP